MANIVRMGVVGAGSIAVRGILPHLALDDVQDCVHLAAVCDPVPGRAAAAAARFGVDRAFTDYEELLARGEVDAVTIASPIGLHYAQGRQALEAGKHVFCEKPLAMTVAEARAMTDAAERSGHVAMVGFTFRYTWALQTLRRLLREGALGTPFYVSMHVHWGGIGYPDMSPTWLEWADQSAGGTWADGASPAWMQQAARAIAEAAPNGQFGLLEGQTHDVAAEALAPVLVEFFTAR